MLYLEERRVRRAASGNQIRRGGSGEEGLERRNRVVSGNLAFTIGLALRWLHKGYNEEYSKDLDKGSGLQ